MNDYKAGLKGAYQWHKCSGYCYVYPQPRNSYERGWNAYAALNRTRRGAIKLLAAITIFGLIYLVLLLT